MTNKEIAGDPRGQMNILEKRVYNLEIDVQIQKIKNGEFYQSTSNADNALTRLALIQNLELQKVKIN